jgi:ribonucleotide monophosphatase NagD (HAD superfamily)
MVCANPDLVVMHQGRMAFCAGAIAQRYETLGGRVRWHGKPFPSVYETCFGLLGIADRRRTLAVGDSLRTDIAGANGAGIDSVLVAGGIHAEEFGLNPGQHPDRARLEAAIAASGHRPQAAIAHFVW